jgi:hypothetical protein
MKAIFIIIASVLTIAVALAIGWFMIRVPDDHQAERPHNVPLTAFWKGSVEEGFWFIVNGVDTVERSYHFKIFNDYDGELVMDADFQIDDSCRLHMPSKERIADEIVYFEFDKIVLDSCILKIQYPAFGGSFWELEKKD